MFFNFCIYRMANPYNSIGCNNISQPQAGHFVHLMKRTSGRTRELKLLKPVIINDIYREGLRVHIFYAVPISCRNVLWDNP